MSSIDPVFAGIEIKIGEGATAYAIGDVVDPVPMANGVDADIDAGDFLNVFETASNSSESSCEWASRRVTTEAISPVSKPQCVVSKFSRGLVLLTHRRHRPFKMLVTGPLLGEVLQNAWDRPC